MRSLAALVVGAGLVVVTGCAGSDGDDAPDGSPGAALPDVELPALRTGTPGIDLGDVAGPAVVNLWATWCIPCREELPAFAAASVDHPDVTFVGVDIGDGADEALAFLDELGVDTARFGQYGDPDAELTDAFGVAALPVTVLVDADGRIGDVHVGPLTLDDLDTAIADL